MNVDVVVVTHNSAEHLAEAIGSVDLDTVTTVVVVDNASTDATVDIADQLGVRVIANDGNRGFGGGANQGAALGAAPYVLFLNPDARLESGALDRLVAALEADAALALVSPRIEHPDGSTQRVWWPFPSASASWREAFGLHRLRPATESGDGFVIGACLLVRRSTFAALGGFDLRFWLYAEETDLARRALDAHWSVAVVDQARAVHIGGASGDGSEGLVFEHFHRGSELYVDKHDGRAQLVSLRLALLTSAVLRSVLVRDPVKRAAHRARALRLSRLLLTSPTRVRRDSPAATADHELVVCSLEAWDDVWRRNQFLVHEVQQRDPQARILFVEPAFDWIVWLRRREGHRRRGLRPVGDRQLVCFQPGKVWPRVAGPWADRSIQRQIRHAARVHGLQRPTLWVNDPSSAGLLAATGWPALYDMTDDWLQAASTPRARQRLRHDEAILFADAGAVTVCSPELASTRRSLRPDLELIPNAVDRNHFTRRRDRPADLPAGPVAVYVGTLHEDRLDVDLVVALASALSPASALPTTATVVLVGPDALSAPSRSRLRNAGVVLLGSRPYADVPAYLQHAAVVIIPHVVTPFTESLDPIKAYECVAVGRPTVATPVAGFRDLGAPVVTVDAAGFVDQVRQLIDHPGPDSPGEVPSWTDRADAFSQALARARQHRPAPAVRVVFVNHCAQLSGGELALARLIPALRGVQSHVILGEPGPIEAVLRQRGATVEVLALDEQVRHTRRDEVRAGSINLSQVTAAARDVLALRRRLRQLRPDLVHTNSLKAALYGGVAGRLAGVPVIWHIRDRIATDYLPRPAVVAVRLMGRVLPSAIIVNSRATLETIGSTDPSRAASLVWCAVEPPGPAIELDHSTPFRVAMVGRLAPWKGQLLFIEAFALAFGDGTETAVLAGTAMFGEDDYADQIRALVDRLGLTDRVELAGFVDDVPHLLQSVDAVVHASVIAEPFGQVVIEGMAAGRPVIAPAAGGPLDIITDGVDGLLFAPGDVTGLAQLLVRLAADPELADRLGRQGRERAREFSPERTAARVEAVYARVLRRPVPPT